jgi:hypothetical protein
MVNIREDNRKIVGLLNEISTQGVDKVFIMVSIF